MVQEALATRGEALLSSCRKQKLARDAFMRSVEQRAETIARIAKVRLYGSGTGLLGAWDSHPLLVRHRCGCSHQRFRARLLGQKWGRVGARCCGRAYLLSP